MTGQQLRTLQPPVRPVVQLSEKLDSFGAERFGKFGHRFTYRRVGDTFGIYDETGGGWSITVSSEEHAEVLQELLDKHHVTLYAKAYVPQLEMN